MTGGTTVVVLHGRCFIIELLMSCDIAAKLAINEHLVSKVIGRPSEITLTRCNSRNYDANSKS